MVDLPQITTKSHSGTVANTSHHHVTFERVFGDVADQWSEASGCLIIKNPPNVFLSELKGSPMALHCWMYLHDQDPHIAVYMCTCVSVSYIYIYI